MSAIVEISNVVKEYRLPGGWLTGARRIVRAVDGVSLTLERGEVFGLVGESGCGKTTLGRMLLHLVHPTNGEIRFAGRNLGALSKSDLRSLRSQMQIVFQNPLSSLSPRLKIEQVVAEPLRTHGGYSGDAARARVLELLGEVGLGPQHLDRFPHELSGGQCQRVAVARALALRPSLLVLDEPTSALDVSVQAQIINLLADLKETHALTYLFISHDLGVVEHISDRIGVMYLGKLVELGPSDAVFSSPLHPYTIALLRSVPEIDVSRRHARTVLPGSVPSPINPPPGCRFHTRCPIAQSICSKQEPPLREVAPQRHVACHFVEASG